MWSWAPDRCLTPRQTGWLTVGRNLPLTLTSRQSCYETCMRGTYCHYPPSRMYPSVSRRKPEMDYNRPKHGVDRRNLHQILKGTTITETPSNKEFIGQRSWMRKPSDDADKITRKSVTSTMGVNDPRNFFATLSPTEFRMTMKTTWATLPRVSNSRRLSARQVGRLLLY
jgi:hypothetical protein